MTYNVANKLRFHATDRPDAIALKFPVKGYDSQAPAWDSWTFAELDRQSDAFARGFREQGIRPGDRTLLLIKPSLRFYAVLFGLFKLGAVPVLLDPGMGIPALLRCIERNEPRVAIALSAVHAVRTLWARKAFAKTELCITDGWRLFWGGPNLNDCHKEADDSFVLEERAATDDAAIIFTSGSTGTAKGVASKQAMFAAQVEALGEMFQFKPGMVDAQAFAAFAIFDICLGMTSVIPEMNLSKPATAKPENILDAIEKNGANAAFASPIVWQNVRKHCASSGRTLKSTEASTILTVGAPIPAYLHRAFGSILPDGSQIWTPYGATEAMPISWIGTAEILAETAAAAALGKGTCVGTIAPGATAKIIAVTDDPIASWSDDLALPAGTVGEIVVRGDQVSPEYKNAPEANKEAKIADGDSIWHRMGDLGYLDEQGRLWFCGRKSHRLETEQGTVPAVPVEGVFNEHPDVFRTALVGAGARGSEVPVLLVEMEPGKAFNNDVEMALRALAEPTPHAALVKKIIVHPGFPTDARHNSKIRRGDLKAWVEARGIAEAA